MKKPNSHRNYLLHIFAFSSFAIAQPLLDIISKNVELLVAQKAALPDLLILIAVVSLAIPLLLYLPGRLLRLRYEKPGVAVLLITIGLLVSLFVLMLLKNSFSLPDSILIGLALVSGGGFTYLYQQQQPLRMFCSYLSPAIILVPILFLLHADVSRIAYNPQSNIRIEGNTGIAADIPVVMLVFDELPLSSLLDARLQVDPVRYPNFAALAADSHWFRNAQTQSAVTTIATPALLSGSNNPQALPILADYPQNLFTLLEPSHRLNVNEIVTSLCPQQACSNGGRNLYTGADLNVFLTDLAVVYLHLAAPTGLSQRLPVVSQSWSNFRARRAPPADQRSVNGDIDWSTLAQTRYGKFSEFVESIDAESETTLHFYHALLPHMPWEFLPSGKLYSVTGSQVPGLDVVEDLWGEDSMLVNQAYQRHLLQLGFVDHLLGSLVQRLKSEGLYEQSLLIVVSDHGANFWPGSKRRADIDDNQLLDVNGIAMFIKQSQQLSGAIHDELVYSADLLPTIAGHLGLSLGMRVDGKDLFATDANQHLAASFSSSVYNENLTLAKKIELFGSGDPASVFSFGPHPQLLGLDSSQLNAPMNDSLTYQLNQQAYLNEVDSAATVIPAWLTGTVFSDDSEITNIDLLIAVNGSSVASTTSYRAGDDELFSVLVPESAFVDGSNDIELYRVGQTVAGESTLERLVNLRSNFFSYLDQSRMIIADQQGRQISVTTNGIVGAVDNVYLEDNNLQLSGWAVNLQQNNPADYLLLDVAGSLSYLGNPTTGRTDIREQFGNTAAENAGFFFNIPYSRLDASTPKTVRILAVSRNIASAVYSFGYLAASESSSAVDNREAQFHRLSTDNEIIGPENESIAITLEGVAGFIDRAAINGDLVEFEGWAANVASNQTADYFLLQVGQRLLYLGGINTSRPDVANSLNNPAYLDSGFFFKIDASLLELEPETPLRLFAVIGEQAIEISSPAPLTQLLSR